MTSVGLGTFLSRVYATTGVSLCGTFGLAYALSTFSVIPAASTAPVWLGGAVAMLGSVWALARLRPNTTQRQTRLLGIQTSNKWHRKLALGAFLASAGIVLTPLMPLASSIAPWFVPVSLAATAASMYAASAFARARPDGALLRLQAPLVGGLGGAAALATIGGVSVLVLGPNAITAAMVTAQPYVGVALLAVLIAADSHAAASEYEQGEADHMRHAVGFHQSAATLVQNFVRWSLGLKMV